MHNIEKAGNTGPALERMARPARFLSIQPWRRTMAERETGSLGSDKVEGTAVQGVDR